MFVKNTLFLIRISTNDSNVEIFSEKQFYVIQSTQEEYALEIKYSGDGPDFSNLINVKQKIEHSGAVGDPHFSQYVQDEITKDRKLICYDVTGEAGQSIFILSINKNEYEIYGKLLDDYYLHSFQIISNGKQLFFLTTNNIFYKNRFISVWNGNFNKKNLFLNDFQISIKENSLTFKNLKNDEFKLKIIRNKNYLGKMYLDINFDLEMMKKEFLGGLIGDISNHFYKFFQNVQNNHKQFILVNKNVKSAELIKRGKEKCFLFNVFDLIPKNHFQKYVFFSNIL